MIRFFVKASRPSKEEKALAEKIQSILAQAEKDGNKEILSAVESHGAVYNLDGLKKIYDIVSSGKNNNENTNIHNTNNDMGKTENNSEESTPVVENNSSDEVKFEEVPNIAEESQFQQPPIERENAYQKYATNDNPPSDENNGEGVAGGEDSSEEPFEEPREEGDKDEGGEDFTASGGTGNLKDLPPDTKRKAIRKTSEIVAKIYAGALPILPKLVSKIPEAKLERMSWNDEIDLGMRLELPDGTKTNVGTYIRMYNNSLDTELIITPDQQKDFQDCLKDVLEEKQVAMTPIQRLTATVCAHAFTMLSVAVQNTIMMKKNLDYWKEVHEENKRRSKPQPPSDTKGGGGHTPPPSPPPTPKPEPKEPAPSGDSESDSENNHGEIQEENEEVAINPEDAEER